ncbi:MAG: TIGR03435 family protein [Janthinobacterium lividum]
MLLGTCVLPPLAAQSPAKVPAYDVSSVKPHDPTDQSMSWRSDTDGFRASNVDLRNAISSAWDLRPDQVVGEPSWVEETRWDIVGKSTELTSDELKKITPEQQNHMMQQLLVERFHLKAHLETRTGPVFHLVPAKSGVKLTPIAMTAEEIANGKVSGTRLSVRGGQAVEMVGKNAPLSLLIKNLALNLHRTVLDNTGLPSNTSYDFSLRWARDVGLGAATDTDALPLPAALEDQLGLHVEAARGPVQKLVVDHVDRPAAN